MLAGRSAHGQRWVIDDRMIYSDTELVFAARWDQPGGNQTHSDIPRNALHHRVANAGADPAGKRTSIPHPYRSLNEAKEPTISSQMQRITGRIALMERIETTGIMPTAQFRPDAAGQLALNLANQEQTG